jgi:hypothetical protein
MSRFSSTKCGFVADSFATFFTLMELELSSGLAYKLLLIRVLIMILVNLLEFSLRVKTIIADDKHHF